MTAAAMSTTNGHASPDRTVNEVLDSDMFPPLVAGLVRESLVRTDPCKYGALTPREVLAAPSWRATLAVTSMDRLQLGGDVADFFGLRDREWVDLLLASDCCSSLVATLRENMADIPGDDLVLGFRTSGSRSDARSVAHSYTFVHAEAHAWVSMLPPFERVESAVPLHHLYGFIWGLMVPAIARRPATATWLSPRSLRMMIEPGSLAIAAPVQWRAWARSGTMMHDAHGISSAAAMSTEEAAEAARSLGLRALWNVYGSTETGGVAVREHPRSTFRFRASVRPGAIESSRIRSLLIAAGERVIEVACVDALTDRGDGCFDVGERLDEVVKVNGERVVLSEIEGLLRCCPAVQAVALRTHGDDGDCSSVSAFIVPAAGRDHAQAIGAARRWLRARYPLHWAVGLWVCGDEIPANEIGKPLPWS